MNGRDHDYMSQALALAANGLLTTDPNPAVGCVIVRDGEVVGEGWTAPAGGAHAEVSALAAAGDRAVGATAYISLEPCAHQGRTGPCTEALIGAGIKRVVCAVLDPNPRVNGAGVEQLRAAGIEVESGVLETPAQELNRGYFARMARGRPWLRCKIAASLDGRTALANGESQWITAGPARRDVHNWRARSSAVVTGIGTILADDPALTARLDDEASVLQPARIILDTHLRTPPTSKTLALPGRVLIFSALASGPAYDALAAVGAELECVDAAPDCDLQQVLKRLAALEFNDLWLEAGSELSGAFVAAGLVDEFIIYLAPDFLGGSARGMLALPPLTALSERYALDLDDVRRVGRDLRIVARPSTVASA